VSRQPTDAQIVQQWDSRVKAEMDNGRTRAEAVRSVATNDPESHQQYLSAYSAETRRGRRPGSRGR